MSVLAVLNNSHEPSQAFVPGKETFVVAVTEGRVQVEVRMPAAGADEASVWFVLSDLAGGDQVPSYINAGVYVPVTVDIPGHEYRLAPVSHIATTATAVE